VERLLIHFSALLFLREVFMNVIAIYVRISTNDGRQNTENQLLELRAWSKRLGATKTVEYIDEVSGSRSDRKALNQLLSDISKKRVSTILIWALDRLSREGISKTCIYLEQFKRYGIRLMSHQESWLDTNSPTSELLMSIFAWIAKQERTRISERVKLGLKRAASEGKRIGRPKVSFDYKEAIRLKNKGYSVRKIAASLKVSKTLVQNSLYLKSLAKK
jgi:DNA invertase Pin-like site-specific DNA recombinase